MSYYPIKEIERIANMKINVIKIDKTEYIELKHKATLYDERIAKRSDASKRGANKLTKDKRTERARHAAQVRWSK